LQQAQLLVALLLALLDGILIIPHRLFNSEIYLSFIFLSQTFDRKKKKMESSADGQPNNSIIKMKKNAAWTVYLQPNWAYDVAVTIGSQDVSTYNLKVIGSSTYTLARSFSLLSFSFFPHLLSF